MNQNDRVMLLIDADNVSVDVMEQAVRLLLNQHGGLHVRRAYCTAESAVKHQSAFKRLGIKPMVNLASGKNSTDIALAVDAIDLVVAERPQVVVIASSDSDFAPLVMRLREKGCVVRGIGQSGKTGAETQEVYDDFTVLDHHRRTNAAAGETRPARKVASRTAATRKTPARGAAAVQPEPAHAGHPPPAPDAGSAEAPAAAGDADGARPPADKTATRKTAAKKRSGTASEAGTRETSARKTGVRKTGARQSEAGGTSARKTGTRRTEVREVVETPGPTAAEVLAVVAPAPQEPAARPGRPAMDAVLACLPELARGQGLALNVAVQRLREAQLLSRNSSSLKLFAQLSDRFELVPQARPTRVLLRP